MLPNNLEFLYIMLGCFKLGAVIVPLNTALSTEEVKYVINHLESVVLLTDGQYISRINSIRADLDLLKKIIVVSDEKLDEDFLHFSGRKKDIIRRGGKNIGAQEVEDVLNAHPDIAESAVIPVPDRVRNEEIKAFIILKPGRELNPEMIVANCSERLADFKVPRYIEFIDSFSKTAKMTIKKHELRNLKEDHTVGCFDMLKY